MSNLMLVSPSKSKFEKWKNGLNGCAQFIYLKDISSLKNELGQIKPEVLLLDHALPQLNGVRDITGLRKLSPDTKIVLMSNSASDDQEWAFFKAGVRGCCRRDIDPESLKTMILALQQGQLWIRRTLTNRLLEQLAEATNKKNKSARESLSLLASLTRREYAIAVRVSNGENNKKIADALDISERTVKAHLTEVYRKLGKVDRLKLALILAGDERQVRRDETGSW